MNKLLALGFLSVSVAGIAMAEEEEAPQSGDRAMSGMSIVGNQEAPKALVIVPWKGSEVGGGLGLSNGLEDLARPVDKEVFRRELSYYQIRTRPEE